MGNVRFKDLFTPSRWKSFTIFLLKRIIGAFGEDITYKQHEIEQYHFRMLLCKPCVDNGTCLHCGCNTMGRMMNKTDHCSNDVWGPFMEESDWMNYKDSYSVKFKLEINGKVQ